MTDYVNMSTEEFRKVCDQATTDHFMAGTQMIADLVRDAQGFLENGQTAEFSLMLAAVSKVAEEVGITTLYAYPEVPAILERVPQDTPEGRAVQARVDEAVARRSRNHGRLLELAQAKGQRVVLGKGV